MMVYAGVEGRVPCVWTDDGAVEGPAIEEDRSVDGAVEVRVEGPSKEDWLVDGAADVLMGYDWPVKVRVEGPIKDDWLVDGTVEYRVEGPAKDDAIGVRVDCDGSLDGAVEGLVVEYGTEGTTDGGAVIT